MPRTVQHEKIDTKTARGRLKARGKPYYRDLGKELSLGYRRLEGRAGTWWARFYAGRGKYEWKSLGIADDKESADGVAILDWAQAQEAALALKGARALADGSDIRGLTVRYAVEAYVEERDKRHSQIKGRPVRSDAATRLARYVLETAMADTPLNKLEQHMLTAWRADLPDTLKPTTKQRLVNDLRAALNAAYEKHRKQLGHEFPLNVRFGLKAPKKGDTSGDVTAREDQMLSDVQVGRLLNATREIDAEQDWDGDLFRLVVTLAATGARFSQVARIKVGDVQRAKGRLLVPSSRKGRNRSAESIAVPIGRDVLDALLPAMTGRKDREPLLERWRHVQVPGEIRWQRVGRGPWQASEITRPWAQIRIRAKLPTVIPYALRHSSIIRGIRANLPIRLVAALHDTSVAMIERHYSKWITSGLDELAARAVVPLVPHDGSNVTALRSAP